jgi:hypothetical protein
MSAKTGIRWSCACRASALLAEFLTHVGQIEIYGRASRSLRETDSVNGIGYALLQLVSRMTLKVHGFLHAEKALRFIRL